MTETTQENGNFEPIYDALVTRVLNAVINLGFKVNTVKQARLLRHWSDVPASEQPALFFAQGDEIAERRSGQLTKWTLHGKFYIYGYSSSDRSPVAPLMNRMLGAVRTAMDPDQSGPGRMQFRNTLGGLVFDCYISGKIATDEGYLGQQGVAQVPIIILANGP